MHSTSRTNFCLNQCMNNLPRNSDIDEDVVGISILLNDAQLWTYSDTNIMCACFLFHCVWFSHRYDCGMQCVRHLIIRWIAKLHIPDPIWYIFFYPVSTINLHFKYRQRNVSEECGDSQMDYVGTFLRCFVIALSIRCLHFCFLGCWSEIELCNESNVLNF